MLTLIVAALSALLTVALPSIPGVNRLKRIGGAATVAATRCNGGGSLGQESPQEAR